MRRVSKLSMALLLVPALACAAPLQVLVDRDDDAELTALCSYAWTGDPSSSGQPVVDDNALIEARVKSAVFGQLEAKGLYQAAGGQPDLTVHFHAVMERNTKVVTHRNFDEQGGVTLATSEQTEVFSVTEGTLLVDIHDGAQGRLIWRGVARDLGEDFIRGGESMTKAVDEAVRLMFEQYPHASSTCSQRPGASGA